MLISVSLNNTLTGKHGYIVYAGSSKVAAKAS